MAKRNTRHNIVSFEQNGKSQRRHHDPHATPWLLRDDDAENSSAPKYVRNVRPRSAGQQQLYESIRNHSLTLALGPAGSGKPTLPSRPLSKRLNRKRLNALS